MTRMTSLLVTLISSLLFCASARAVPEAQLETAYRERILPFLATHLKRYEFTSQDGVKIKYSVLKTPSARGTIVLSPGRTESTAGYSELIYDFAHAGFDVAIIDHRGQGESGRLVPTDAGHVGSFNDYVTDFAHFANTPEVRSLTLPQTLVSTSMGSAIAGLFVTTQPARFSKFVMISPMLKIKLSPLSETTASAVTEFLIKRGYPNSYAPTFGPFDLQFKFSKQKFTHSELRYTIDLSLIAAHKNLIVGGPTNAWVHEAIAGSRLLRERANQISVPTLLISSGADFIVSGPEQRKFCSSAKNCTFVSLPGAYHCLFFEADVFRNPMMLRILSFIDQPSQ